MISCHRRDGEKSQALYVSSTLTKAFRDADGQCHALSRRPVRRIRLLDMIVFCRDGRSHTKAIGFSAHTQFNEKKRSV